MKKMSMRLFISIVLAYIIFPSSLVYGAKSQSNVTIQILPETSSSEGIDELPKTNSSDDPKQKKYPITGEKISYSLMILGGAILLIIFIKKTETGKKR